MVGEGGFSNESGGPDVEVGVNQVVRVDLTLQVGASTQTLEVTGKPPLLQDRDLLAGDD